MVVAQCLDKLVAGLPGDLDRSAGAESSHGNFAGQRLNITTDGGDGDNLAVLLVADQTIAIGNAPVDFDRVPRPGVADIADGYVVVLAPEERNAREGLPKAEHVLRRDLPLALRHDPMFDAPRFSRVQVEPLSDVASSEYAGHIRLEEFVHEHTLFHCDARIGGQRDARLHASANDDKIGIDRAAVAQRNRPGGYPFGRGAQMENDAVLFMQRTDECAEFRTDDCSKRIGLRRDNVDRDAALAKRG